MEITDQTLFVPTKKRIKALSTVNYKYITRGVKINRGGAQRVVIGVNCEGRDGRVGGKKRGTSCSRASRYLPRRTQPLPDHSCPLTLTLYLPLHFTVSSVSSLVGNMGKPSLCISEEGATSHPTYIHCSVQAAPCHNWSSNIYDLCMVSF